MDPQYKNTKDLLFVGPINYTRSWTTAPGRYNMIHPVGHIVKEFLRNYENFQK